MTYTQNPTQALKGLTSSEVAARIASGQGNTAAEHTSRSVSDILQANIFTRFNAILGVLLVLVVFLNSPADTLFGLIIFVNTGIGVVQELRAKRTLDRLAILNAPTARALRDGRLRTIAAHDIVLDDVLELQSGDQVLADGIVLSTGGLEADESLLTGESEPILKQQGGRVLSGSFVVAGEGRIQVTAVGANAYAHQLTAQVKRFSIARSELVDGTNRLLTWISWIIAVVGPLLVLGQIVGNQHGLRDALIRSTAAIAGMIPEGLVLLTSLAFALAILSLARRQVLVQQLPAVEGLARADVICIDKTGTLTDRAVVFDQLLPLDNHAKSDIAAVLATFASRPNSPTLQALHDAFKTGRTLPVIGAVPFSSARKWSALSLDSHTHWVMGAPEILLPDATKPARAQADAIAQSGKRVMLLARAKAAPTAASLPGNLQPVALIALAEHIRADAKKTLRFFAQQGVALKILSGDNPQTVASIAARVGVPFRHAIDARSLPTGFAQLAELAETNNVFGRVTPGQKRTIIKALQSRGHVVAMAGDGVNDALALKDADIGIAMASGAQATKAIAEIVLLDSKFARLPKVLAEGTRVIANIERVASLFVIKNVYTLILALAVTLARAPFPFLPRHLTVLSTLTIGLPAFFLALAPNSRRYRPGFLMRVLRFSVPAGAIIGLLVALSYNLIGDDASPTTASTTAAIVVVAVGSWILYRLATPLNWWKACVVIATPAIFALLVALPHSRALLYFSLNPKPIFYALGLSVLGAVAVDVLWRQSQKLAADG